jgi:hypothetical protein
MSGARLTLQQMYKAAQNPTSWILERRALRDAAERGHDSCGSMCVTNRTCNSCDREILRNKSYSHGDCDAFDYEHGNGNMSGAPTSCRW